MGQDHQVGRDCGGVTHKDPMTINTTETATLLRSAIRFQTPCGDGVLVWHVWGRDTATQHRPVVLLHGGSGSWTHWVRNIQSLVEAGREVWVPDLPGFGDSALPATGHDADALAAPLELGLQQLIGSRVVDLVGFSFGGMVSGYWAADFPARVACLVVVGAPALGVVSHRTVVQLKGWRHFTDEAKRDEIHRHNLSVLMLHDPLLIDAPVLELHKTNVLRDRMPKRRLSVTDVLAQQLKRVVCPLFAIYGREDALYQGHLDVLSNTLSAMPTFQKLQLLEGAGHWVQYERADAFNIALRQLLNAS